MYTLRGMANSDLRASYLHPLGWAYLITGLLTAVVGLLAVSDPGGPVGRSDWLTTFDTGAAFGLALALVVASAIFLRVARRPASSWTLILSHVGWALLAGLAVLILTVPPSCSTGIGDSIRGPGFHYTECDTLIGITLRPRPAGSLVGYSVGLPIVVAMLVFGILTAGHRPAPEGRKRE